MNNTGEQVADDNRKKDYTSAGSATHSLYCRLPPPPPTPNGPDDTYNPCPRYRNHFHEDCTLHICSTEACKDGRKNSKSPSLPPSESSFHRSCFHLSPARQRHSFYLPPSVCDATLSCKWKLSRHPPPHRPWSDANRKPKYPSKAILPPLPPLPGNNCTHR